MGILSNRVEKHQIKVGDHIYAYRAAFAYSHHGIFVGGNRVVQFTPKMTESSNTQASWFTFSSMPNISASCQTSGMSNNISASCGTSVMSNDIIASGPTSCMLNTFTGTTSYPDCGFRQPNSGVVITCLDCFLQNGSPYRFEYGVGKSFFFTRVRGGTCTTAASDPPQTVIYRAMHLLQNGFGNYDVFQNNCEDFALYCKTGFRIVDGKGGGSSGQASSFVDFTSSVLFSSAVKYTVKYLVPAGPVSMAAVTVGTHYMSRYYSDIGVRTDVTKVDVEDVAVKHGGFDSNEGQEENKASD